jgi:hypothetical protein
LYTFLISLMSATCPIHLIVLDLIILIHDVYISYIFLDIIKILHGTAQLSIWNYEYDPRFQQASYISHCHLFNTYVTYIIVDGITGTKVSDCKQNF